MRSYFLLTSVLVARVLDRPQVYRRQPKIGYGTEVVIHTIVVAFTQDYLPPASTSLALSSTSDPTARPPSKPEPKSQTQPLSSSMTLELHSTPFAPTVLDSVQDPSTRPTAPTDAHISGIDQAYLSVGPEYRAAVLFHHNAVRANHTAAPSSWDSECEANAISNTPYPSIPVKVRTSLRSLVLLSTSLPSSRRVGTLASLPWRHSGSVRIVYLTKYSRKPSISPNWFGRALPRSGVSLDCGAAMTVDGRPSKMNKYTVCNYSPAGNAGGKYAANVVPPLSSANHVGWVD